MLALLSPSKTLDTESISHIQSHTQPELLEHSESLVSILRDYTVEHLQNVMNISSNLAELNAQRYKDWSLPFTTENAKQAALMFQGDVYTGLDCAQFDEDDFVFAQTHLGILSGLYGFLRPLDLIRPYRLEMGLSLITPKGKSIYDFWGDIITNTINEHLEANSSNPVLINVCSREYFKVVKPKKLQARLININFKEHKNGQYRVVGYFAKKARGAFCHYMVKNRITDINDLKHFNLDRYQFSAKLSTEKDWVFYR